MPEFLYKPFAPHPAWPFVVAVLAAILFAVLGLGSRGRAVAWGLSGALLTLGAATVVSGLADATAIPYTDAVRNARQITALLISVLIVASGGVFLALSTGAGARLLRNLQRFQVTPPPKV